MSEQTPPPQQENEFVVDSDGAAYRQYLGIAVLSSAWLRGR